MNQSVANPRQAVAKKRTGDRHAKISVTVRLTEDEKEALREYADEEGRTMTVQGARFIVQALRDLGRLPSTENDE